MCTCCLPPLEALEPQLDIATLAFTLACDDDLDALFTAWATPPADDDIPF